MDNWLDAELVEPIDWDSLEIDETHDTEGRILVMSDEQLFDVLGLRDVDESTKEIAQIDQVHSGIETCDLVIDDTEGAILPTNDTIADELMICYDRNNPCMDVGTKYPSMKDFKLAVRQFAINKEFELDIVKSDKKRYRVKCGVDGCPWRLVGHSQDDKVVMVTVHNEDHNCTSTMRIKTSTASSTWVADKAIDILKTTPNMGAKELQKKLQDDHKVTISYDIVWHGKEKALKELYGSWEESFQMLYRWKEEILKRAPDSVVEIDVKVVDGRSYFHRFFCALGPCIKGFVDGCRPYLSVDSTALNGRWNGHLAAATSIDGHNWMYPVAFGFIDSETEDNWVWFMTQLHRAIGECQPLAICSDACKGLENAVQKVFHGAEQRECFFHLMKNFEKRFHGDTFGSMYPAARAYREIIFQKHMTPIINAAPEVWTYLSTYHKLKWMRCGFNPAIKCDYITNNIAEVFNNWIRDIKDLPVVDLADKIREMIMVLWNKRRRIGERLHGRILPAVIHQLKARTRGLGHLKVVTCSLHTGEVQDNGIDNGRHVVSVAAQTCTCEEWQHTGQPCGHALAFLTTQKNVKLEEYVDEYYSVAKFIAAYKMEIPALPDKSHWPEADLPFDLGAPLGKRNVGRQRKLRIKGCLEIGGKNKKKMVRGPITCKRCGEKGHRQASYKCTLNGTKKRKRKPRNNKKYPPEISTQTRQTNMETMTTESPGTVSRHIAMLLGDNTCITGGGIIMENRTCAEGENLGASNSSTTKKKKMTPKKKRKT